jgi:hypothetical protein
LGRAKGEGGLPRRRGPDKGKVRERQEPATAMGIRIRRGGSRVVSIHSPLR